MSSSAVSVVTAKVRSRRSWVATMVGLGTVNLIINILNLVYFTVLPLKYGLVISGPSFTLWVLLCVFVSISIALYILETLNTVSVFYREGGQMMVPINIELLITLPLQHIPLGAINYFICWCRNDVTTSLQSACGAFRILFIFLRIVWYAHLEGRLLKANDKRQIQLVPFMSACALYALVMSFPVQNWRIEPSPYIQEWQAKNVSIFLLKAPFLKGDEAISKFSADELLKEHGLGFEDPSLVNSIWPVISAGKNDTERTYSCDRKGGAFIPTDCKCKSGALRFRFRYDDNFPGNSYGVIRYNYAFITQGHPAKCRYGLKSNCTASTQDLQDGWRLRYLVFKYFRHSSTQHVNLTSPTTWGCFIPRPLYDQDIQVCS